MPPPVWYVDAMIKLQECMIYSATSYACLWNVGENICVEGEHADWWGVVLSGTILLFFCQGCSILSDEIQWALLEVLGPIIMWARSVCVCVHMQGRWMCLSRSNTSATWYQVRQNTYFSLQREGLSYQPTSNTKTSQVKSSYCGQGYQKIAVIA